MRRFFVDTFYLIALSNRRDQWHRRMVTFSRALHDVRLYTVAEVLAEFLTLTRTSGAHTRTRASQTVRNALQNPQGPCSPSPARPSWWPWCCTNLDPIRNTASPTVLRCR